MWIVKASEPRADQASQCPSLGRWASACRGCQHRLIQAVSSWAPRRRRSMAMPWHCAGLASELLQQRLGFLQVRRIKALREPAVDRREQLVGLKTLALLLPQPAETQGSAQFPGFGLLVAGHRERLLETGLRLGGVRARRPEEPLSLEAIEL